MSNITPLPPLFELARKKCPDWCRNAGSDIGHPYDRLPAMQMVVITHLTDDVSAAGVRVQVARAVAFNAHGNLIQVTERLIVGDENIEMAAVPDLIEAITQAHQLVNGEVAR